MWRGHVEIHQSLVLTPDNQPSAHTNTSPSPSPVLHHDLLQCEECLNADLRVFVVHQPHHLHLGTTVLQHPGGGGGQEVALCYQGDNSISQLLGESPGGTLTNGVILCKASNSVSPHSLLPPWVVADVLPNIMASYSKSNTVVRVLHHRDQQPAGGGAGVGQG